LRQAGEWNAINSVSDKFCKSFADGWSKLNKLSGKYITGNELETYLKAASLKLEEIVAEREEASKLSMAIASSYVTAPWRRMAFATLRGLARVTVTHSGYGDTLHNPDYWAAAAGSGGSIPN